MDGTEHKRTCQASCLTTLIEQRRASDIMALSSGCRPFCRSTRAPGLFSGVTGTKVAETGGLVTGGSTNRRAHLPGLVTDSGGIVPHRRILRLWLTNVTTPVCPCCPSCPSASLLAFSRRRSSAGIQGLARCRSSQLSQRATLIELFSTPPFYFVAMTRFLDAPRPFEPEGSSDRGGDDLAGTCQVTPTCMA